MIAIAEPGSGRDGGSVLFPPSPSAPLTIGNLLAAPLADTAFGDGARSLVPPPASLPPYVSTGDAQATNGLQAIPSLGAQTLGSGQPFSFALPPATFASSDPGAVISVEIRQANGQPLPSWMRFDPATGTLSGQPPAGLTSKLTLEVIARDSKGNRASTVLEFRVKAATPARPTPGAEPRGMLDRLPPSAAGAPSIERAATAADDGRSALQAQFAQYGQPARDARAQALLEHLKAAARQRAMAES